MRQVLFLPLVLSLTGCLTAPPPASATRLVGPSNQIRAECASQPTHLAQERCANPRILALYRADGTMPMDVGEAYMARREAIAEKIDNSQITETEGAAEMAEARAAANAQATQRTPHTVVCTDAGGVIVCR